ncbi:Thermostable monoacylglycerol lipase [compost metagenome]
MNPIIVLVSLVVLIMGAVIVTSYYLYNMAIKRSRQALLSHKQDLAQIESSSDPLFPELAILPADAQPASVEQSGVEWVESQKHEIWRMTSEEGLKLIAYYLPAPIATAKTVIIAHGYTSKGKEMGNFARFYYEKLGYNVLLPDDRGHGASEGDYIGFGWIDRKDYLLWIQKVVDTVGKDGQIVLHGLSMGGATVMMVSGEALPEQVKVIVEDCGYTSVYDQLAYQLKQRYKLPRFPLVPVTSFLTKIKAGYYFHEASALKQLQKNKLPMLFIHGDSDTFVPTEMVWRLYQACTTEKDIYIVKGASHGMAYGTDQPTYEQKVAEFVGQYI